MTEVASKLTQGSVGMLGEPMKMWLVRFGMMAENTQQCWAPTST